MAMNSWQHLHTQHYHHLLCSIPALYNRNVSGYEQRQETTSIISRPCDEKGKARAFVDNMKDRRKKKHRSSKNLKKMQDGIATWLGRSTAEMFVDARDREKWKVMIAYACNRHGN